MQEITYDMLPESQKDFADIIGVEATLKLCEARGGEQNVYIPKNDKVKEALRNREIQRDYARHGHRITSLARQNNLSERTVQRLVKEVRPRQMRIEEFEK